MISTDYTSEQTNGEQAKKVWLKITLAIFGLILTLVMANVSIHRYEKHLASGQKLLLELAPVDPRSLMQGDYMALRYAIASEIMSAIRAKEKADADRDDIYHNYRLNIDGLALIKKDNDGVGKFVRLIPTNSAKERMLTADEMVLHFRVRKGQLKLATNAFFFQEGHAKAYEAAEYGLFRVNNKGEPLLTNMVNKDFKIIDP